MKEMELLAHGHQDEGNEALNACVWLCWDAAAHDDAWPRVLEQLCRATDSAAALMVQTGTGSEDDFFAAHNCTDETVRDYFATEAFHAPRGAPFASATQTIWRWDARTAANHRDASDWQPRLSSGEAVRHGMRCVLGDEGTSPTRAAPPPVHLWLFRSSRSRAFHSSEAALPTRLRPYLERAFRLHWQRRVLAQELGVLQRGLDRLDFGVVLMNSALKPVYVNRQAKRMAHQPTLASRLHGLPDRAPEHGALASLLKQGTHGHWSSTRLNARHDPARPIDALTLPLPTPECALAGSACAQMLILSPSSRHTQTAAVRWLAREFGLSAAEARLLPPMMNGLRPAAIATQLGLRLSTVRSQLASLYAKTSCTCQQDLILLLATFPPVQIPD